MKPSSGLGPIYYGKHLASMKFEDGFCIWSIYIPGTNDYQNVIAYSAILQIDDEDIKDKWNNKLTFSAGLNINNKEDFDKLVLGAMAELSGRNIVPKEITYENILSLSCSKK